MIVFFRSFLIFGRGVFGVVGLIFFVGGGYLMDDVERMLKVVEKGINFCWGYCGVCSIDGGVAVIILRSLFSFVFCYVKEYLSFFKMVRMR